MAETIKALSWFAKVASHCFDPVKERKPKIKNEEAAARSLLGGGVHVKPVACDAENSIAALQTVHSAIIIGEIVEVDEQKAVVSFSKDGETELRDFPWSMVEGGKGRLTVGDRVIARTELELMPRMSDEEMTAALEEIDRRAEQFVKGLKGASAPPFTVEEQQAADSARKKE